jgi:O-antigen/teichoic acid export membrane protein
MDDGMSQRYGGERFKRGLWHFLLGKAVSAAAGFLAMVQVVRLLPIHEFASYSVLISLVELFVAFSALGLSHALLRYVPELYVRHYKAALNEFVFGAFVLRTMALLFLVGITYVWAKSLAPVIGLGDFVEAFKIFLLVVIFRSTNQFLSQILESTLHQGIVQLAFSVTSILRLIGMLYLMRLDNAGLIDVIWVELWSDALGTLLMLFGIAQVIWRAVQEESCPVDDGVWVKKSFRQIARFALYGYVQHIVGLPFGSNTNRLVGGRLFSSPVMASFGFAQSLYEYIKRYLPAQLLVGLIRPIVVARFSVKRDFSAAATTCERIILINTALIGGIFALLGVCGIEILTWVSGGKYGIDALWVLAALLVVLALETHRLILEMLVQTVERYGILIPTNVLLSLSIIPAVLSFPLWGAIGFPLINAAALVFSNFWVRRQLADEGYVISHEWRETVQLFGLMLVVTLLGNALKYLGVHWLASAGVAEIMFIFGAWKLWGSEMKKFVADMSDVRKKLPEKAEAQIINQKVESA